MVPLTHQTWRPLHLPRGPPSWKRLYCPACWNSLLAVTHLPCFVVLHYAYCLVVYSLGVLFIFLVRRRAPWGQGLCLINHSILRFYSVAWCIEGSNISWIIEIFCSSSSRYSIVLYFHFSAHYINIVGITSEGCLIWKAIYLWEQMHECIISGVGGMMRTAIHIRI